MEANEIQSALEASVSEVLETMCFASIFESAEGFPAWSQSSGRPWLTVELGFQGASSGRFRVSAPVKLASVLGAGFLARGEDEMSDSQAEEVLCEISNMICGAVLGRLESNAIFKLSHPRIVSLDMGQSVPGQGTWRWFDTSDGILAVSFER